MVPACPDWGILSLTRFALAPPADLAYNHAHSPGCGVRAMNEEMPVPEVRGALANIQRYLADSIPPLEAVESLSLLFSQTPALMASEIGAWVAAQYEGQAPAASVADYLFHALKKIHLMSELQLVSTESMASYMEPLKQLILEWCPGEERETLRERLSLLGTAETALAAPVAFIHHSLTDPGAEAAQRGERGAVRMRKVQQSGLVRRSLGFAHLLERLERAAPSSQTGEVSARSELAPQIIAAAARNAESDSEFQEIHSLLQSFGIKCGMQQAFHTLGRSLPAWTVTAESPSRDGAAPSFQSSLLEAMRRIIELAGSDREKSKRFQDLVEAAIEQFNRGSLPRAATMLELAESLADQGQVDRPSLDYVRSTLHESLDNARLRAFSENSQHYPLLVKVLNFFDQLRCESLLDKLENEPNRSRRRQLLNLIEAHGEPARAAVVRRLESSLASSNYWEDWYITRNLVYLLHRLPRSQDSDLPAEMALVARLLDPNLPLPLIREAVNHLGQIRNEDSEKLLTALVERVEGLLLAHAAPPQRSARLQSLLDRIVFVLARLGTPSALRAVTAHGLKKQPELGDTAARLAYLAGQDLTNEEEMVAEIIGAVRSMLPRKVLRFLIQKESGHLPHLLRALSSTPAPAVRQLMTELAERFPAEEFGLSAAKILEDFDKVAESPPSVSGRLMGDLELFGLPDLLQQLARTEATGQLTLRDRSGADAGSIYLHKGRMADCRSAHLAGNEAFYALFERPVSGAFVFVGQHAGELPETIRERPARELTSLIAEGMRRYDEYQWLCIVAPDEMLLRPAGCLPPQQESDEDAGFYQAVWDRVMKRITPAACEASISAEPLRIRRLLARWLDAGALAEV